MTDLTPGKRAEWRKDAQSQQDHDDKHALLGDVRNHRIIALLDALATENDRADKATEDWGHVRRLLRKTEARADKAEQEVERLKGVCNDWGNNYQSWVDATRKAEQERDDLQIRLDNQIACGIGNSPTNPPTRTCTLCGEPVVWHTGNGGQWLGANPPNDCTTCGCSVDGQKHGVSISSTCDGSFICEASPHVHGCYADKGDCDDPKDHIVNHKPKWCSECLIDTHNTWDPHPIDFKSKTPSEDDFREFMKFYFPNNWMKVVWDVKEVGQLRESVAVLKDEIAHWKGSAAAASRGCERWRKKYEDLTNERNDLVFYWQAEAAKNAAAMVEWADRYRAMIVGGNHTDE